MPTIGRNDPCHCGSGKKYKKCCEEKDQTKRHAELEQQWADAAKAMPKPEEDGKPAEPGAAPSATPRKPEPSRQAPPKHQAHVAPKVSMPRKSGGG